MEAAGLDPATSPYWPTAFNETVPAGGNTTASGAIYLTSTGFNYDMITDFSRLVLSESDLPIIHGCKGECKAKIRAPALAPEICSTTHYPANYSENHARDLRFYNLRAPPLDTQSFQISIGLMTKEVEKIYLVTGYFDGRNCTGTFHETACTLESTIGEYDVTISNQTAVLDDPVHPRIIAVANNTAIDPEVYPHTAAHPSTLSTIAREAYQKWETGKFCRINLTF